MKKIRNSTFETNSSSTHAIVVPKMVDTEDYCVYDSLDHNYCFGREESRLVDAWDEKLAYIYMVLKDNNTLVSKEKINAFKCDVNNIWQDLFSEEKRRNQPTPNDVFNYIDGNKSDGNLTGEDTFLVLMERNYSGVDHSCNIDEEIFDKLLNDKEFVKRLIFNKMAYITIGGDEYRGYNIKTIGFEYDYEDEWINGTLQGEFWNKLEKYKEENDVYLKGN